MEAIGGYFGLADYEEGNFPFKEGILLNTGRNALEYILRSIGKIKRIYLPSYTCEAVLEPLIKLHIPRVSYHITSHLEIADEIQLDKGEFIIVNNYFGIKDQYIERLANNYGQHLIVDNAQALFAHVIHGIKSFCSPRKFIGVADGGIAYLGDDCVKNVSVSETDCSDNHNSHLYTRKNFGAEAGFKEFQENEKKLDNQPIRWMSDNTKKSINHLNSEALIKRRKANFSFLHDALKTLNKMHVPDLDSFICPMVYPFIPESIDNLREFLISQRVFVAKYWPHLNKSADFENDWNLAETIIPIPCDQRYEEKEMNTILDLILNA